MLQFQLLEHRRCINEPSRSVSSFTLPIGLTAKSESGQIMQVCKQVICGSRRYGKVMGSEASGSL